MGLVTVESDVSINFAAIAGIENSQEVQEVGDRPGDAQIGSPGEPIELLGDTLIVQQFQPDGSVKNVEIPLKQDGE